MQSSVVRCRQKPLLPCYHRSWMSRSTSCSHSLLAYTRSRWNLRFIFMRRTTRSVVLLASVINTDDWSPATTPFFSTGSSAPDGFDAVGDELWLRDAQLAAQYNRQADISPSSGSSAPGWMACAITSFSTQARHCRTQTNQQLAAIGDVVACYAAPHDTSKLPDCPAALQPTAVAGC